MERSVWVKTFSMILVVLPGSTRVAAQNAPDELVFESDAATIDSLKRTDYPYLFPILGYKVQKMGVTMPLSAGLGVNYLWQESHLAITDFTWSDVSALDEPAFSFMFGPRLGRTFKFDNPQPTLAFWVGGFRLNVSSATSGSLNLSEVLPLDGLQGRVDQGFSNVESADAAVDQWSAGLTPAEQQKNGQQGET